MLKNLCPNFAPVPYVHYLRFSCLLPNDCATTFLTINEKLFEWLAQTRRLIRNQNGIIPSLCTKNQNNFSAAIL